jgi:voltage-gated potassium channel
MSAAINDRRSLYLLLSLLVFFLLSSFLQDNRLGEFFLVVLMYVTLIPALLKLHGKRTLRWLAISVAIPYMLVVLTGIFYPIHRLVIADYSLLMAFFGFSSVALFAYLGQPGAITGGRVYASVSLYLMLATFWFALYNVIETSNPGSFVQTGAASPAIVPRPAFLYFSLITLTTVGYGDILPISPVARMFAALEGATGVLYIAITVARLVAGYQRAEIERV